jgi:DNA-binding NarL/FixJ family response regulator
VSRPRRPEAALDHAQRRLVAAVDGLVAGLVAATADHVQHQLAAALATIPAPLAAARSARGGRRTRDGRPSAAAPALALEPDLGRVRAALADVIRERGLSQREAQILVASVHGTPRDRLAEVLGVGENTIKTQVRVLLGKLDLGPTLNDAVWAVRCRADGRAVVPLPPR